MSLANIFKPQIELVVIRDIFNPKNNETYNGYDVELLLKQAFGSNGLSESVHLYHGDLLNDVTPKTPKDVDKVMRLRGRIYAVVKPMGIGAYIAAVVVSTLISVAVAYLMPVPTIPSQNSSQAPSPNNALAARTNQQRLGGRIPDIFGTAYSVPDLTAVTYSVYIDHKEVEMSAYRIGRGKFDVKEAYDDTTPINQVFGSSVLVFDPDTTFDDEPAFQFGTAFTADEAQWSRMVAKRYTAVNGQELSAPDEYVKADLVFKNPNIIETSDSIDFGDYFESGNEILIEGADNLESANGVTDADGQTVNYTLGGQYIIDTVDAKTITLVNPQTVADWQKLADNVDITSIAEQAVLSTEPDVLWQGWFYTDNKDHSSAYINLVANNGLWAAVPEGGWFGLKLFGFIESEIVDSNNNPIEGTLNKQVFDIASPLFDLYAQNGGNPDYGGAPYGTFRTERKVTNEKVRGTAAKTVRIENPNFSIGKRMRVRISRSSQLQEDDQNSITQSIKIKDFYGIRSMTPSDYMPGTTNVLSKTLGTEGALSLKERKLRLLVQRYVTDATSGLLKLSNRADDIIRHIAMDEKIGNLQLSQIDIAQIKTEIDAQIAYFGTDKCAQFCYTFDDNNLSAEETFATIGKAVFSQVKRQGNKIMLDFERKVLAPVAIFNSHNILPDTFTMSQSLGIANDYDGVTVKYTDPDDDATVTLSYPSDALINPHEDELIGVRNEVQAHMHMMRLYNKDQYAYKSCEFTAGDESNVVVRTNCIAAADQLRADIQEGSVYSIETIGSDVVLHTTDPVVVDDTVPHTLFIQTINNGVESIAVTARDDYSVILARLPSGEISSGYDSVVQAVYQIVSETDSNRDAYLVSQKDPSEGMTNKLLCTNYDDRYYQNDSDLINGLIT